MKKIMFVLAVLLVGVFLTNSALGTSVIRAGEVSLVMPSSIPSVTPSTIPAMYVPEIVQGIEVYGLTENIDTKEKYSDLEAFFSTSFEARVKSLAVGVYPATDYEKRDLVWGRNTRVLEVVVRRSDYLKDPVGSDFVLTMKVEVDLMTRLLDNTKPKSGLTGKLLRIVVVDDKFEDHPRWYKVASDIDHSEFIGGIEAGNKYEMKPGEFIQLWSVNADSVGTTVVSWKEGVGGFEAIYSLPAKNDSVMNLVEYKVSYYRIHELFHRLFGLPDEYLTWIRGNDQPGFRFQNHQSFNGNFVEPKVTTFISSVAVLKRDGGVRGRWHPDSGEVSQQNITNVFAIRPDTITLKVMGASSIKVFGLNMNGGCYYGKCNGEKIQKTVSSVPDQSVDGPSMVLNSNLFTPTTWVETQAYRNLIVTKTKGEVVQIVRPAYVVQATVDGIVKEVSIPVTVFVMSKLSGVNDATYEVVFWKTEDIGEKTLYSEIVSDTKVNSFSSTKPNMVVYASMKIPGTSFTMVWYQERPAKGTFSGNVQQPTPLAP